MNFTIIIPTFNRDKDLSICLESILKQNYKPLEVIVVDDSTNDLTKELVKKITGLFSSSRINIIYLKNSNPKSLARARNKGIDESNGEIIVFLDDDVVLDLNYLYILNQAYERDNKIYGVQGYITNFPKTNIIVEFFNKLFLLNSTENAKCRVLPSSRNTYPNNKTIQPFYCEWLSGCNHSYKKEILKEFRYDEKMIRYSYKEDVDMSYRIYKKHPQGLFFIPSARCMHNESKNSRILKKEQLYMEIGYTTYFFYKNIDQCCKSIILFHWSNFGFFIKKIGEILIKTDSERLCQIKYLISGYRNMLKHLSELKNGELHKFNLSIFEN